MSFIEFQLGDSDSDSELGLLHVQQHNVVPKPNVVPNSNEPVASTSKAVSPTALLKAQKLADIEEAIALNKLADEKLCRLEKILGIRLNECNTRLAKIAENKKKSTKDSNHKESFRYVNCGKPYFKDKDNFTPPHNKDTITMQNSGMYDFSSVASVPGWTVNDKSQFITLIHKMSQDIQQKEIETKIKELERSKKTGRGKQKEEIEKKIVALKKEIMNVRKKLFKDVALPIDQEYDWEYLANQLNRRHSAHEYRTLWKLFLHPDINKSSWSKTEHTSLQKIASNNNYQDWDDIAHKLGTKRTGYQCFVYFRTNMSNTFTGQKWTKEEEEYLKRLIDYYKEDNYIPWGKVATSMENRTKIQIYNKYNRMLEQRKGRFLPEEDSVILTCADDFGTDFRRMTSYLPGRSMSQLRLRYQILAKGRISTVWTVEEDNKLIKLLANQQATAAVYSSLTKHFPDKDRLQIRSRYTTLVKWMKLHPNTDISAAPRHAARRLGHGQASDDLNKAIENLKKRFQSEVENRKCKKITINSPEHVIDDAIMAQLVTQITRDEENKKIQEAENERLQLSVDTVVSQQNLNSTNLRNLLILLKSNLNKKQLIKSKYCQSYPELIEGGKEVSLVKVKSYSKKQAEKIVVTDLPDIFGVNMLKELNYVLPPNYATITGCRRLMSWISEKKKTKGFDLNINVMIRKNSLLKDQFNLLLERFNSLFLWPMLLSNESPQGIKLVDGNTTVARPLPRTNEPAPGIGIAIPEVTSNQVNDHIDLEKSDNNKEEITITEAIEERIISHNPDN